MQAKTRCEDVISSCDKALRDKERVLELSDLAIKDCTIANGKLKTEVQENQDKLNSPYRNPIIIGVLGLVVGALSWEIIKK